MLARDARSPSTCRVRAPPLPLSIAETPGVCIPPPPQVANKLFRDYEGFKPASDKKSVLQVSELLETGQADTSALPVVDLQRAFSKPAVVAANVLNSDQERVIRVDIAVRAGYLQCPCPLKTCAICLGHGDGGRGLTALAAALELHAPEVDCALTLFVRAGSL